MDPDEFGRIGHAIVDAPDVAKLRASVMEALALLRIHRAWFLAPLTGDPRVRRLVSSVGYPTVWERHYRDHLHLIDPLPEIALRQTGAFTWPAGIAGEPMGEAQKRYLAIVARYGLARGIATACYGPHGRGGFIGAELPANGKADEILLLRFNMIGQLSFQKYCVLTGHHDEMQRLSNRELEVLQWIGFGKSNSVIADLLGISPSSVDVYVRRTFAKLGVTDRTTAAIKAYSMGLIVSQQYHRPDRPVSLRAPQRLNRKM